MTLDCDVLVLGSGLASLCLTRRLRLEYPEITVRTVDIASGPSRKVGESTVELGAHFLHSRLALAEILCRTQLPKNGLRFWFDSAEHDLSLAEASEDGPMTFAWWQTYQLDRESLEETLLDLNRKDGAVHEFGASHVEVSGDGPYRVRFEQGDRRKEWTGRWLVDATGVRSAWARSIGLLEREERVPHGACWARFRGFRSPDCFLEESEDRRPIVGRRLLSTNHLLNEGYWIWWIPLANGLMSVGLVYDSSVVRSPPRSLEGFLGFLREHRLCRDLMREAEPVDFGQLHQFAFRPRRYFSTSRAAAIGVASGFVDPFYSSGTDFIALQCDFLSDLIARDLCGEPPDEPRIAAYDAFLRAFYEQTVLFVRDIYRTFVSFEVSVPRYRRDLHIYWNLFVWPYLSGDIRDPGFIRSYLPVLDRARRRSEFFSRLVRYATGVLESRGTLRRLNQGEYAYNPLGYDLLPFLRFERQMGSPVDLARCERLQDEIDAATFLSVLDVLYGGSHSATSGLLFGAVRGAPFERIVERGHESGSFEDGFGDDFWTYVFEIVSESLSRRLADAGLPHEDLRIGSEDWAGLRTALVERLTAEEDRARFLDLWAELPSLEDLGSLPSLRDRIQPRSEWSFEHSPWIIDPLDQRSVYEILPARSASAVARLYE
jgi:flavin-dependent dehydrogenase